MQVTVRFFGNYRALVDSAQFTLELDEQPVTLLDLLNSLGARYGSKLRTALVIDRAGEAHLRSGIRVAIGDEIIDLSSDLRKPLGKDFHASDQPIRIFIFPALMGGR